MGHFPPLPYSNSNSNSNSKILYCINKQVKYIYIGFVINIMGKLLCKGVGRSEAYTGPDPNRS